MIKPKKGHVYRADIPEDLLHPEKLKGEHPIICTDNNLDNTCRFVGCTSKNRWGNNIPIDTIPGMDIETHAKVLDGERDIDNDLLTRWFDDVDTILTTEKLAEVIDYSRRFS